jgi:hypothetical protein
VSIFPFRKPIIVVDPNRFTGKTFTRRMTFPNTADDYKIRIDGLAAARIMKVTGGFQRVFWLWSLTGPHYPQSYPHNGEEDTYEAARDAFKKLFWQWHAWALKQPGKVNWYGAKE